MQRLVKRFEKPSLGECEKLVRHLQGKTVEQMIEMFGRPVRESGHRTDERLAEGKPWIVDIRRELMFHDIGPTVRRLLVTELMNGKFEFSMNGKEIVIGEPV